MPLQFKNQDFFMQKALEQAKKAFQKEEAPVGAVIVRENQILSQSFNPKRKTKQPFRAC